MLHKAPVGDGLLHKLVLIWLAMQLYTCRTQATSNSSNSNNSTGSVSSLLLSAALLLADITSLAVLRPSAGSKVAVFNAVGLPIRCSKQHSVANTDKQQDCRSAVTVHSIADCTLDLLCAVPLVLLHALLATCVGHRTVLVADAAHTVRYCISQSAAQPPAASSWGS